MKKQHAIIAIIITAVGLLVSSCTNTGGGTHRMGTGKAHQTGMPDSFMPNRAR